MTFRSAPTLIVAFAILISLKAASPFIAALSETASRIGVNSADAQTAPTQTGDDDATPPDRNADALSAADDAPSQGAASQKARSQGTFSQGAVSQGAVSPGERRLLENLRRRRTELDALEKRLAMRERLIQSTALTVDRRLAALKELKRKIDDLVAAHDREIEKDLAKIAKMYAKMKPKDAARLLNRLNPDALIDLVDRMPENRLAAILPFMDENLVHAVTRDMLGRRDRLDRAVGADQG